jgi:hypothetical protein
MLLVLDEAQVLARPEHSELAHALRMNLDSRKAGRLTRGEKCEWSAASATFRTR